MNVLDLFSGIGGFSLGLERAGMKTIAMCEIETYHRRVLRNHWPTVPQFKDVKDVGAAPGEPHEVDVICGGFPCQGLSLAGLGLGLADVRSALWWEFARIIGEFRSRWVIIENVPALRSRGLDQVLGSLAALGYDAEWYCIPAAAFGAPHRRDRIWIVAYPNGEQQQDRGPVGIRRGLAGESTSEGMRLDPDAASIGCGEGWTGRLTDRLAWIRDLPRWNPADTDRSGHQEWESEPGDPWEKCEATERDTYPDVWQSRWTDEPALCGVDDGVSSGVDVGLYALGNSIVPQIAQAFGEAIMSWEQEHGHI